MKISPTTSSTLLILLSPLSIKATVNEKKVGDDFFGLLSKATIKASSNLQHRNIQECAPVTLSYSSLEEDVIKEIKDNFNPTPWGFEEFMGEIEDDVANLDGTYSSTDSFTLDFIEMPAFMQHFEEKCSAESGEVYVMTLDCKIMMDIDMLINKFPLCLSDCPDHLADDLEDLLEDSFISAPQTDCNIYFDKDTTSVATTTKKSLYVAAIFSIFMTIIAT